MERWWTDGARPVVYELRRVVLTAVVLAALVRVPAIAVAAEDKLAGSRRLVTLPGGGRGGGPPGRAGRRVRGVGVEYTRGEYATRVCPGEESDEPSNGASGLPVPTGLAGGTYTGGTACGGGKVSARNGSSGAAGGRMGALDGPTEGDEEGGMSGCGGCDAHSAEGDWTMRPGGVGTPGGVTAASVTMGATCGRCAMLAAGAVRGPGVRMQARNRGGGGGGRGG